MTLSKATLLVGSVSPKLLCMFLAVIINPDPVSPAKTPVRQLNGMFRSLVRLCMSVLCELLLRFIRKSR